MQTRFMLIHRHVTTYAATAEPYELSNALAFLNLLVVCNYKNIG